MCLEYKNYKLPLNDGKPKLILLKAITGFLNSKGGTLYIGVRDFEGTVEGVVMSRKEQDEMTRVILELTDRIEPRLDYNNRE